MVYELSRVTLAQLWSSSKPELKAVLICFCLLHNLGRKGLVSTKIHFLGLENAGWGGVFHAKGWWSKSSFPPSKVCSP